MNVVNEISSIMSELDSLRAENRIMREREVALETENDQLRRLTAKINVERDTYLRKAEAMQSILTQAGTSLVNAMQAYRAGEREVQEQQLDVGNQKDMPKFISEATKSLHAVG